MNLINITPATEDDAYPFTAESWNYKLLDGDLCGWLLLWKTDSQKDYGLFEWLIIGSASDYEQILTSHEGVVDDSVAFYPIDIFLCGDYSYKLCTIDYELMSRIGQFGASTCSDTYIRIFAELNLLHQKLFPQHNTGSEQTITFKEH